MAELATIARPYADALFKAATDAGADTASLADQLDALAQVAADDQLRQFADNPKVQPGQVLAVIDSTLSSMSMSPLMRNLLRTVVENGRLAVLPAVAAQYRAQVNASTGVSDVTIHTAFPIEPPQLADVVASLEKRFGRKLNATVQTDPALIGGVRAVVGDEVFDASVKARLEQMKVALTA